MRPDQMADRCTGLIRDTIKFWFGYVFLFSVIEPICEFELVPDNVFLLQQPNMFINRMLEHKCLRISILLKIDKKTNNYWSLCS